MGPAWGGFYVGVGLGAGTVSQDLSGDKEVWRQVGWQCGRAQYTKSYEPFSDKDTGDIGIFGTVTVGYDRKIREGWVGGVFADYDFGSNVSADVSIHKHSGSIDQNDAWSVGGRLGFLVTPSTLLYGTGGFTQASFDVGDFGSHTFNGYFVGAGVETVLRENWSLRLEYRYSDFGSENIIDTKKLTADLEPSTHSARLVLIYKLGH